MATNITDPFRDIFLAGVGALAIGAEKSKDIVDQLIQKGEITVEQGKDLAAGIQQQTNDTASKVRDDIIAAQMKTMTKDERDAFAARVAELAAQTDSDEELQKEEADEVAAAAED